MTLYATLESNLHNYEGVACHSWELLLLLKFPFLN
jgi:hypothetical protein